MIFNSIVLLLSALFGGFLEIFFPEGYKKKSYGFTLTFAGSFLFAITVIHILPELFDSDYNRVEIGIYILIGFFIQKLLETFTEGAEHGHMHAKNESHRHNRATSLMVLSGLSIHAFLEGALIAHPSTIHAHHEARTLLLGIALHKIPAAYALMSIITCYTSSRRTCIIYLVIFALASPLGLMISDWTYENQIISEKAIVLIFALVSGSFLHISTTIFYESSPQHRSSKSNFLAALIGSLLGILLEYVG